MNTLKISILLFIVSVFISCDCLRYVQGVIIDSDTRLPIGNVRIGVDKSPNVIFTEDSFVHTDSLGHFEIFSPCAMLFVCPKIVLSFEKEGYNKVTKKYRNWNDKVVIVLKPEK